MVRGLNHMVMRTALSFAVAAAMAVSMSPLGMIPIGEAQAAQGESGGISSEEIQAMLDAGDYAEGEAIVIVDNSVAAPSLKAAGKAIASADEIMEADSEVYEEATGDELASSSDEGVSIKHVVREGADTATLMAELAADPRVLSVEPNYLYSVPDSEEQTTKSTDGADESYPAYNEDFDMSVYQWMSTYENGIMTMPDIDSSGIDANGLNSPGWDSADAGENADCVVAIIDTGVDYNHPDLKNVMYKFTEEQQQELNCGKYGASFVKDTDRTDPMDDHGHGTHCAGIAAAAWNGKGTSGVANGVKIMALKVSGISYIYATSAFLEAYAFVGKAADAGVPVRITSNSYGGGKPLPAQNVALRQLGEHGVISLLASGNGRTNVDGGNDSNVFPLNPYTVVVDAARPDGNPSSFTNYGLDTDVFSPGVSIVSTAPSFGATYFPPADENPVLYQSKASDDGTWDTGMVVDGATAALLPEAPSDGQIFENTTEENAIEISQASATQASFDGDGKSLVVTLGAVNAPKDENAYYEDDFDPTVAKVAYLDFKVPVSQAENVGFAGVSAYVTDYAGTWQFDGDNNQLDGKPTIEASILVKVKDESGNEGWVRDRVCYCKNEGAWEPIGFNLNNPCGETSTSYVLDENGCLQMRLRLYGVSGVGFKEGTKIYLDSFGIGTKDTLANMPYVFWDGTSMACPAGAGAAAIINKALETEKLSNPEHASRLCNLVKACVRQGDQFAGICSSGGQIDLSLLNEDGHLKLDEAAPVINSTSIEDGKVAINGFAFGANKGTLQFNGETVEVESWNMNRNGNSQILFAWPEDMKNDVKTITVTRGDTGKSAHKHLLVTAPDASEQIYETQLGADGLVGNITDIVACMTGLDGVLYAITCTPVEENHGLYYEGARLASYDATNDKWKACVAIPGTFAGMPNMTAHEGKLVIAGTSLEADASNILYGYTPGDSELVEYDATNFPDNSTVANCEGQLLVIGNLREFDWDENAYSSIARWKLTTAGTEAAYEITDDDVLCNLNGSYVDPIVSVQGNVIYVASNTRLDSEEVGIAVEKVVYGSDGVPAVTDYASKMRIPWDEDEAAGKYEIMFEDDSFGLAASVDGPLYIGTGARTGIGDNSAAVDADTLIIKDEAKGFETFSKRFSYSSITNVTACSFDGKLYVAAMAIDDTMGFVVRATEIKTEPNPGDTDAGVPVGETGTVDGATYKVIDSSSVVLAQAAAASAVTIPATVTLNGLRYKVTGIAEDCFADNEAQTVIVKSPSIEKAQVQNCFRNSAVTKVVVDSVVTTYLTYKADYDNYSKYLKYVKANKAKKTAASKATKAKKKFNKAKKKLKSAKKKLAKAKKKYKKSRTAKAKKAYNKAKKAYKKAKKNYNKKKKAYNKAKKNLAKAKKNLANVKAYSGSKYKNAKAGYNKYIEEKAAYDKALAEQVSAYAFLGDEAVVGKSGVTVTK